MLGKNDYYSLIANAPAHKPSETPLGGGLVTLPAGADILFFLVEKIFWISASTMVLNRQKGVQGTPKGPGTSGNTQVPPGAANTIPKPKSPTHWEMEIIDTANSTNQVQEEALFTTVQRRKGPKGPITPRDTPKPSSPTNQVMVTLDAAASTWTKTRRRHCSPFILVQWTLTKVQRE